MDNYSTRATAAAVNSLVKHGNKSLAEQDWDAAADYFARALEADSSSPQAHLQLYLASRHLMGLEELPAIAEKIIEVTPAERTPLADVLQLQAELDAAAAERAAAQGPEAEQGVDAEKGVGAEGEAAAKDEPASAQVAETERSASSEKDVEAAQGAGSEKDLESGQPAADAGEPEPAVAPAPGPAAVSEPAAEPGSEAAAGSDTEPAPGSEAAAGSDTESESEAPEPEVPAAAPAEPAASQPEPAAIQPAPAAEAEPDASEAVAEPGASQPAPAAEPAPDSAALRAEVRATLADTAANGIRAPYDQRLSNLAEARAAFEDAFDDEDWALALELAPLDLKRHMERARADAEERFSQAQAQEQVLLDQMCQVAARRVPKVELATSAAEGSCSDALAAFERVKGEEHEKVSGKYSFLKGNLRTAGVSLWVGVVLVVLGALMLVATLLPHDGTVAAAAPAAFPEVFAPLAVVLVAVGVVVLFLRVMLVRANRQGMGAHAEEKASVSSDLARTSEQLEDLVAAVRARELNLRNLPLDAPEEDFDAACAELADSVLDLTGSRSPVPSSAGAR
ncbi:hypothetical protein VXJ25_00380 [Olsenella sp. YH-ols2223]|uniref:Tetratricopeptide repeat protein n=1 Tax=Olsenella absiana TaxID=3115222 RepID=A0ABU7R789_9ACTN